MFRRLSSSLPKDPEFPADLEKLGYCINNDDQIRSLTPPHRQFHYFISKNERVLVKQREAMNTCIRKELSSRFEEVGLLTVRLSSHSTTTQDPSVPHIPILTTTNLSTASRVLILFGGSSQDLGVLAYRIIGEQTIAAGSVVDFVQAIKNGRQGSETAIVIANMGQLVWYRGGRRAVTMTSWDSLPRKTGVDPPMRLDEVKNRVPGHLTPEEHVRSVMAYVKQSMKNDDSTALDIVGVEEGGGEIVKYLDQNWSTWKDKIKALVIGTGFMWYAEDALHNQAFKDFWGKRARLYFVHHAEVETPLYGREDAGCNCYSSGEDKNTECILPKAFKAILGYFDLVNDLPGYEERDTDIKKDEEDESRIVKWVDAKGNELA